MIARRIRFIVGMGIAALIGIFLFQGYWLYNSYQLAARRFATEVAGVLKRLEHRYALNDLQEAQLRGEMFGGDNKRLTELAELLLSLPSLPPLPTNDSRLAAERGLVSSSKVVLTYRSDSLITDSTAARILHRIIPDSLRRSVIRQVSGDTASVIVTQAGLTDTASGGIVTFNVGNFYTSAELAGRVPLLQASLDSLLQQSGIRSPYALQLSNYARPDVVHVTDSLLFARASDPAFGEAKIGVLRPFRLQVAVAHDVRYVIRRMFGVLLASAAVIGITTWAFVAMLRTIFQQKRLSDIKTDFINNMTHEFKTPISTVSLAVEAMQRFDVLRNPAQAREYLDICMHELNRLSGMVEKVLSMAVYERPDFRLTLQRTDLLRLVEDVVDNLRPRLEQRSAVITVEKNGVAEAMVDPTHMANVVYNLLDNSLKYTEKPPRIEVGVHGEKGLIRLTVTDNGIGIPEAYRNQIFENFFRVPTGNIHNIKGFGLGLGYVARIVRKHEGSIHVKSDVGMGSTFTIELPAALSDRMADEYESNNG